MSITVEDMVRREVGPCVSALVSTLVTGAGRSFMDRRKAELLDLSEQAAELCSPVLDYEEAARQAGWLYDPESERWTENDTPEREGSCIAYERAESICIDLDLEPYEREIFEHWIVSDWLADKLKAEGERVDKDFAGLCVWGRTTSGQGIACDSVMHKIHADLTGAAS